MALQNTQDPIRLATFRRFFERPCELVALKKMVFGRWHWRTEPRRGFSTSSQSGSPSTPIFLGSLLPLAHCRPRTRQSEQLRLTISSSNSITFGMLGPVAYNLSLRDSALVILFFNLLATSAPGVLATFGPKTGMRQMIHARYSFG